MKTARTAFLVPVLAFCVFFTACSDSTTTSPAEPHEYESGECYDAPGIVVVAFDENMSDDAIRSFVSDLGLTIQGDIFNATAKWVVIVVPEGTEDEWIVALTSHENVVTAERNQICPTHE